MTTINVSHDLEIPDRVMVIAAHPDDAEFCAGATLAKWGEKGAAITHVVLTDGSKGTWDATVDQQLLIQQRQAEQRAAAAVFTTRSSVEFIGLTDGDLAYLDTVEAMSLRRDIARLIRQYEPQVILAHDPWKRYRLHPDHEQAGRIAIQGIVGARDPFFHPELLNEGLSPHRPDALLLFEADEVNHVESISQADAEKKVDALLRHISQTETTHFHRVQQEQLANSQSDQSTNVSGTHTSQSESDALEATIEAFRIRELRLLSEVGGQYGLEFGESFALITDQL